MNKIIYSMAAALVICMAMTVYSSDTEENLQENVMRLHIIANSDSDEDQEIKLIVRDAILKDARENGNSNDSERFEKIAGDTLKANGFTYTAHAEYGKFSFPRKTYKDMTFPAGEYNGLRVILGEGKGKNWWCVMNPPLCFTEDPDGKMSDEGRNGLKESLDEETYDIITEKPEIRFKIVEIINGLKEKR